MSNAYIHVLSARVLHNAFNAGSDIYMKRLLPAI